MKIVWTEFAINQLKVVFDYYVENANSKIAHKIRRQILGATKQLISHPESGQFEPHLLQLSKQYRYLVVGHWKVIYRIDENQIVINDIFDARQNPRRLKSRNR
jgi:plasmid stabilization system protein ParE